MLFLCFGCYNNVINKGHCSPLVDYILEEIVHHSLESGKRVDETKVYDYRLIYSYVYHKSGFPFISLLNPNIIVALS